MKHHIFPAIRLTLICIVVFMGLYPLLILAIAKLAPAKGEGETVTLNNKTVGYKLEGQSFTKDNYFWGRPSAVGYNAAGSGGSNKGPSNPDYLKDVQNKIDTFLVHNPSVKKEQIPSELVTASGSGLDPDISLQAALIQTERIAKTRNIKKEKVEELIQTQKKQSINGIAMVNVLQLNMALDNLK
ncbi:MAG: potassium-transporting ATPase subunit KdpC [Chitinophaga sp.]|jgi:potassium-transporting ATPase KdpC subunit|nr:potassium-transporting ATPase subunit KdpC [Chitinophaga sp.]